MPTIPNTLIVFGADEDSFFLGHGRRHTFQGVPDHFASQVQGVELPVTQTDWIAFDPTGTKYIANNDKRGQLCHSTDGSQDLMGHVKANGASFITLGSDDNYFIKHKNGWNARLPPKPLQNIAELKPQITNFDSGIRGVTLFGHGQTHIFMFAGGFVADLNEETEKDPEHPLTKILNEFDQGWCIEPGSTLCPYSDRYFFLKFKKRNDSVIQMRWCLPNSMSEKLTELHQLAESPEDQTFLTQLRMADMQKYQTDAALAMQRMRLQTQMNDMLCQTMIRAGNSFKMATGDYVEVEDGRQAY
ncbi:hypothetical protein B0H10DRAFT_1940493 [Mycena sp. CBHHK59/15]|nr:hypothetical protein B0H10DRAFT_1940493 [Mycena sp. CBHHK59/15]